MYSLSLSRTDMRTLSLTLYVSLSLPPPSLCQDATWRDDDMMSETSSQGRQGGDDAAPVDLPRATPPPMPVCVSTRTCVCAHSGVRVYINVCVRARSRMRACVCALDTCTYTQTRWGTQEALTPRHVPEPAERNKEAVAWLGADEEEEESQSMSIRSEVASVSQTHGTRVCARACVRACVRA